MSIRRKEDGSILEEQDRPGYAKHWVYDLQAVNDITDSWVTLDRARRLDQAIQYTLAYNNTWKMRIVQTTTTVVWQKGSDIGPIGEFPNGIYRFDGLANRNFGGK